MAATTNGQKGPRKASPPLVPVEERIPPHDDKAETALLSAMFIDDDALERVGSMLAPGDFYSGTNALIFQAVREVGKADTIMIAAHLRENGRLPQVGGMAGITEVLGALAGNGVSRHHVGEYAEIVRRHAREREFIVLAQHATAELYAWQRGGRRALDLIADLRMQLDRIERDVIGADQGIAFLPHDDLWREDPPDDLVIPGLGLCAGPPTGLFGQGYVGKSVVSFSMGMSVALGKDVWGAYSCKQGKWVHLDYEQGRKRSKALVQRMARGFCAGPEDLGPDRFDIAIYPDVTLTSGRAVDAYARAMDGARICTADALKGMTPGVDENSSEMRDHMGVLRLASEKTGCMVVLIHHAGKTPQDGSRPRKEAGRGSSAIFDECQSVFVLSGKKGEPTTVSHEKDRVTGITVDDFGLKIEDVPTDDGNPRGALRVVHLDNAQLGRNGGSDGERSLLRKMDVVREAIGKHPGVAGVGALAEILKMRKADVTVAVHQLMADGYVVEVKTGGNTRRLFLKGHEIRPVP